MDEGRQRRTYAVLALVTGILGMAGGGTLAVIGVWVAFVEPAYLDRASRLLLGGWGAAGLIGIAGWLWLSGCYLRHGRDGLRASGRWAWAALWLGMLASVPVVGMAVWHATESPLGLVLLLAGPPMALPAARLVQLRRTRGS
ncbi:hypothetical protein [Stenotrophomonas sp. BIGb0135]|jgi:MFS family permease|uniref:hypothetical protein n=1 Tax=Stenotrophomonas sp. BIGb0135 TaxID=2940620 RepID=UPI0021676C57|nr:hypothetical protein [Stenotrophomonas sp. BIGb0135]MCS4236443.1 MFS family permease [Stenotrophomonas sp. BIGb0135]